MRRADRTLVGGNRIDLLEAIDRSGSISGAARAVGISYKTAWDAVDAMNNAAEIPLVLKATGASAAVVRYSRNTARKRSGCTASCKASIKGSSVASRGVSGTWVASTPCFGGSPCESARGTCFMAR
jgi:Bacterial regulatory helix-turn-helix protein, lysR family